MNISTCRCLYYAVTRNIIVASPILNYWYHAKNCVQAKVILLSTESLQVAKKRLFKDNHVLIEILSSSMITVGGTHQLKIRP